MINTSQHVKSRVCVYVLGAFFARVCWARLLRACVDVCWASSSGPHSAAELALAPLGTAPALVSALVSPGPSFVFGCGSFSAGLVFAPFWLRLRCRVRLWLWLLELWLRLFGFGSGFGFSGFGLISISGFCLGFGCVVGCGSSWAASGAESCSGFSGSGFCFGCGSLGACSALLRLRLRLLPQLRLHWVFWLVFGTGFGSPCYSPCSHE